VHASVTRRGTNRIGGKDRRPVPAPVAVVAASAGEAEAAASAILARSPGARLVPATLAAYLSAPGAPAHVILCASRGSADRGIAFLARAAARILWPAPPADMDAAIGGLRAAESLRKASARPSRPKRSSIPERRPLRAALLLEGPVDLVRARAALSAVADTGPRDWIVESVRHVRLGEPNLADFAKAGIRWSVLEPIELLAVYAAASVARTVRRKSWLPRGTPVWITTGRNLR
jgi:hypothetical protein